MNANFILSIFTDCRYRQLNERKLSYNKFLDEAGDLNEWRQENDLPQQHYERTFEDLRDQWIKDSRLKELIAFIHENWDSGQWNDFFIPVESHLIENNLSKEYKRFWKGLLRRRLNALWDLVTHVDKEVILNTEAESKKGFFKTIFSKEKKLSPIEQRTIAKQKETLNGLESYIQGLKKLDEQKEIKNIEKIIISVKTLVKPKPSPSIDKRKIDETLFWVMIEHARTKMEDKFEFIEKLSKKLENFKPSEIRKFERIFRTKLEELNRSEVWALSYIVRKGCGDDSFDYFKAWVISKGLNAFNSISKMKADELKQYFDEDPQLEEMLYLAENVYEFKTGEMMKPIRVKKNKLKKLNWTEETVETDFPELCELFEYKK